MNVPFVQCENSIRFLNIVVWTLHLLSSPSASSAVRRTAKATWRWPNLWLPTKTGGFPAVDGGISSELVYHTKYVEMGEFPDHMGCYGGNMEHWLIGAFSVARLNSQLLWNIINGWCSTYVKIVCRWILTTAQSMNQNHMFFQTKIFGEHWRRIISSRIAASQLGFLGIYPAFGPSFCRHLLLLFFLHIQFDHSESLV